MRILVILIFLLSVAGNSFAQIVIDESDMPKVGDTLRVSITTNIPPDYEKAGADQVWDFTGLTRMSQRVESFVDVMETPNLFWFTFIPNITANLASPGEGLNAFPGLPFSDYYTFFKNSSSAFSDAGFGFLLSGIPIALKYNTPDVYYHLPCTMGDDWSSSSSASLSLPGIAYFGTERTRQSVVDGWGTLKTPFGTFQAIRVKSELIEYDSLYMDTLGTGIPIERIITEYKWLGKGQGIPLLQITEEAMTATAVYRDALSPLGINNVREQQVRIYPNPARIRCTVNLAGIDLPAVIRITNISGSTVYKQTVQTDADNKQDIDLSTIRSGFYLLSIQNPESTHSEKLILIK